MLELRMTGKMKQDIKKCKKRGLDMEKLQQVIDTLCSEQPLPERYKDHPLSGEWKDFRECHIENDWLLIYRIFEDELILSATRTGTHSDFGW